MLIKQISVFVENKKGRLADVTKLLAEHQVDIIAISIADTTNFGILRMIVSDPEKAYEVIRQSDYTVNRTEVIAVDVPDSPGGLNRVLGVLDGAGISVEYLYSFLRTEKRSALILFRVEEPDHAVGVLQQAGIRVYSQAEICH